MPPTSVCAEQPPEAGGVGRGVSGIPPRRLRPAGAATREERQRLAEELANTRGR
ncbi:MAG: hypothetical protein L0H25_01200 [Micrococcales bacterium]|nr:hypothetical protein [Micrococcales bacterium]